jgi:hypothetical protein
MSCESTSSLIVKLWKKYGEEATKIGCAAAGIATANPETVVACVDATNNAEKVIKEVISFWNNQIAGNSWAKIGPRSLSLGESETGTLQSIGDRTYITPAPINCDIVKLTLKETDGEGETAVDVCKMDTKGNCNKVKSYCFNDTTAGKNGQGSVELEIDNVKGKYLVVLLNGKNTFKKFAYTIKLEKVRTPTTVKA